MKTHIRKFLDFNGKTIFFLNKEGQYWIAIKPICDALNLEYTRQFKNIKEDEILGQLLAEQPMVGADGRTRKMSSLPEHYIYGWLFSIQSSNKELNKYKWQCYDVLYDYFHGSITQREKLIGERVIAEMKLDKVEQSIAHLPEVQEIHLLKGRIFNINKNLKNLDAETKQAQLSIFERNQ